MNDDVIAIKMFGATTVKFSNKKFCKDKTGRIRNIKTI